MVIVLIVDVGPPVELVVVVGMNTAAPFVVGIAVEHLVVVVAVVMIVLGCTVVVLVFGVAVGFAVVVGTSVAVFAVVVGIVVADLIVVVVAALVPLAEVAVVLTDFEVAGELFARVLVDSLRVPYYQYSPKVAVKQFLLKDHHFQPSGRVLRNQNFLLQN